jgi:hypothetical protein
MLINAIIGASASRCAAVSPSPSNTRCAFRELRLTLGASMYLLQLGVCNPAALARSDPRGDAPLNASSPNEVVQPNEIPSDDDETLASATPDPTPQVPDVMQRETSKPAVDVIEQAGVGGPVAFGSAGVLEVGGSGALIASTDYVMAKLGPTIGWFVYDGVQLSYTHEIYGGTQIGGIGVATLGVLDVSVHTRINDRLLCFVGLGPGLSYNGETAGFGGKTRAGLDVLVGRSGLFRPAAFYTLTSNALVDLRGSRTNHHFQYGLELEYAALF